MPSKVWKVVKRIFQVRARMDTKNIQMSMLIFFLMTKQKKEIKYLLPGKTEKWKAMVRVNKDNFYFICLSFCSLLESNLKQQLLSCYLYENRSCLIFFFKLKKGVA